MTEMTPFERQVEHELEGMVGPIPRFDAIEIAETAAATARTSWRWPRVLEAFGLAAAAGLLLLVGIGLLGRLPTGDDVFVVALDGSGDYGTVSEAVDAADDGAVIWLAPGTYEETVEVTSSVHIRGEGGAEDEVVFVVPDDGPAFRLRDADATISDITLLSKAPSDLMAERRPVIDIRGGSPIIENLRVRADAPEWYRFIKLNATDEGTVIRNNRSSGSIVANQGAIALIEDNVLLPIDDPDWPEVPGRAGVGIVLERVDVDLVIRDNELNAIAVYAGLAEIMGNDIHGTTSPLTVTEVSGGWVVSGECGVSANGDVRPVLSGNRVHGHATAICGAFDLRGGEIYDNGVGLFVGAREPADPPPASTARETVIRDNDVGIEVDPHMGVILSDVALCGNGIDIDAPPTASIVRTGSAECPLPDAVAPTDGSFVVAVDGTGDFSTVAEAVAASDDGDVIRLQPGIYEETIEVTRDIEIHGQDGVVFHIPSDGPAFELTDADALISGIEFISQTRTDGEKRRPAIIATGGAPVLEDLIAHADVPERFDFIRLYETERGTVVRNSTSSGVIRANRGAEALIEGNVLVRQEPDAPGAGVAVVRSDTFARIVGNELNFVDVAFARAELVGNDVHGARPLVSQSIATSSFREGACGVSVRPGEVYLTTNRIHDNETGICGGLDVYDGEIADNVVGVWSAGATGQAAAEEFTQPTSIRETVISGNEIGIRVAPLSEIKLSGVALCDNGIDLEGEDTARVQQLEPAECQS